jgi:hypothetical protein
MYGNVSRKKWAFFFFSEERWAFKENGGNSHVPSKQDTSWSSCGEPAVFLVTGPSLSKWAHDST